MIPLKDVALEEKVCSELVWAGYPQVKGECVCYRKTYTTLTYVRASGAGISVMYCNVSV